MTLFTKNRYVNIDITNRCPLMCHECQRQQPNPKVRKWGGDISMENFQKTINYFNRINFCGQRSDPIHHPKFLDMLKMCNDKNIITSIHTASTYKPLEWFSEAFNVLPTARWWFGLDGKPEDSPKYRVNQDGFKMLEIMKLAGKTLKVKPYWQYIVFNFNQHYIDEMMIIAEDIGVELLVLDSYRWENSEWLKPEK